MARVADERAAATVAAPHGALYGCGDESLTGTGLATARSRLVAGRELLLFELANQCVQPAAEHRGNVARGQLVAEELSRVLQLLVGTLVDGHLNCVSLRSEGCDASWWNERRPRGGRFVL